MIICCYFCCCVAFGGGRGRSGGCGYDCVVIGSGCGSEVGCGNGDGYGGLLQSLQQIRNPTYCGLYYSTLLKKADM